MPDTRPRLRLLPALRPCAAMVPSGQRCRNHATRGDNLCAPHARQARAYAEARVPYFLEGRTTPSPLTPDPRRPSALSPRASTPPLRWR
jgi:hypothetical protein